MQEQGKPDVANAAPSSPGDIVETEPFEDKVRTPGIADDEVIDRSVKLIPQHFRRSEGGEVRVSASAFNDRSYEPSFYREVLCEDPPYKKPPRMNPDDAVASVTIGKVREQEAITFQSGNDTRPTTHRVDVRPEVEGHHAAHVVVFTAPEFKTKGGFAKLKELLAQIVGGNWAIRPNDTFLMENTDQIPKK